MEEKDYKKLYEDVLERAKNGLKDKNYYLSQTAKEATEYLFPQLKETEDEKVRKNLTRFLINFNNGCYSRPSENEIDSWLKWIDKKCEQKSNDKVEPKFKVGDWVRANRSGNIFKILSVNDRLYRVLCYDGVETNYPIKDVDYDLDYWTIQDAKDGDVLVDCFGNICIYQKLSTNTYYHTHCYCNHNYFIDGGGSHEVAGTYPATKEQRDLLSQKMKEACYKWDAENKELRKIEQNPADKDEPKFKVGDWIIGANDVYKIISLNNELNCYIVITQNNKEVKIPYYFDDGQGHMCSYHLWTIQDAKDGDVLAFDNDNIVIFKDLYNATTFHSYCHLENFNKYDTPDWWEGEGFHPADKEQHELLFSKMKEAGYEWDAEKKELKNIEKQSEQKSQSKSALEVWKDMRLEVYMQASGNRHEPNYSDDSTKMFSLNDIDEIFEKVAEKQCEQKPVEWVYPYGENETVDKLMAIAECLEMDEDFLYNGYTGTECVKFLRDLARKQVECKPVDNVEPKFKVGDIISDGISEAEIVSIDENKYNVTDCEIENYGYICNWVIYFKDQDKFKLVK